MSFDAQGRPHLTADQGVNIDSLIKALRFAKTKGAEYVDLRQTNPGWQLWWSDYEHLTITKEKKVVVTFHEEIKDEQTTKVKAAPKRRSANAR